MGVLILSKLVLVIEHVSWGAWVRARPVWVDVVLRTVMFSLGIAVVLLLEKGFEGRHKYGGFVTALGHLFRPADSYHIWANTICLSGALLGYNIISVVNRHLGKSAVMRFTVAAAG